MLRLLLLRGHLLLLVVRSVVNCDRPGATEVSAAEPWHFSVSLAGVCFTFLVYLPPLMHHRDRTLMVMAVALINDFGPVKIVVDWWRLIWRGAPLHCTREHLRCHGLMVILSRSNYVDLWVL